MVEVVIHSPAIISHGMVQKDPMAISWWHPVAGEDLFGTDQLGGSVKPRVSRSLRCSIHLRSHASFRTSSSSAVHSPSNAPLNMHGKWFFGIRKWWCLVGGEAGDGRKGLRYVSWCWSLARTSDSIRKLGN